MVFRGFVMEYGNLFVRVILSYYLMYVFSLIFSRKTREGVKTTNTKLNELRKKSFKTVDEQREFINLKYPKLIGTFKWSWKLIPKFGVRILIFLTLIMSFKYVFAFFNLHIKIWQAILFMIIFPIIINLILEKFKLERGNNMSIFFRGWFK